MSDITKYTQLIDKIDEISSKNAINLFVPSLNKTVKFKPLTILDQQKLNYLEEDIFKNDKMSLKYHEFCKLYDQILEQSCLDDIDLDTLYNIDRIAIALQHREEINNELLLGVSGVYFDDIEDDDSKIVSVDLKKVIKTVKKVKIQRTPKILKHKDIEIGICTPTIKHDKAIGKAIRSLLQLESESSPDKIDDFISENFAELLLLGLARYVAHIKIGDDIISTNDDSVTGEMFVALLQQLPMRFIKLLNDNVDSIKESESKYVTFPHPVDGKIVDIAIEIDTGLFTEV